MGAMKGSFQKPLLLGIACLVFLIILPSMRAQDTKCQRFFTINDVNVKMDHCKHIGNLGSTLSWVYNAEKGTIIAAFKAQPVTKRGWVAWGINPSGKGIVGTEVLLAQRLPNGTLSTGIYKGVSKTGASPAVEFIRSDSSEVQFESMYSVYRHDNVYIYATVVLPSNRTTVNQAWQVGSPSQGGLDAFPVADPQSFGTIDLLRGKIDSSPTSGAVPAPPPYSSSPSPSPPLSSPPPSPRTPSPSTPSVPPSPSPSTPNPPSSTTPTPSITPPSASPSPSTPKAPSSPTPKPSTPPSTPSPSPSTPNSPTPSTPSPSPNTPNPIPPPSTPSPSPSTPNSPSSPTPTPFNSPPSPPSLSPSPCTLR